ncbi:DUF4238 domain-containing protein [Streptomyces sp. NPDC002039]|uniref:DUF4238 domain-containing protein n=1 Tax=Streptomyces sp. NPDC002039 TaxID=3154660 RepID=UPI00332D2D2E
MVRSPDIRGEASDPFWSRVRELEHDPGRRVRRQHLVSKVLLKRFTAPGTGGQGPQLYPYDLDHPHQVHKLKGPAGCGWVEDFVPFASGSLESVWARTEQHLPRAFAALDAGRLFEEPEHHPVLRDLIALHWVRSHFYRNTFDRIYTDSRAQRRQWFLTTGQDLIKAAALQELGLHLTGLQGLQHVVDELQRPTDELYESGALLRIQMEDMFYKVREHIATAALEIHTPATGELLIGDTPAQTIRKDGDSRVYGMAIGDATTMVIPLGPKHLLTLGRHHAQGISWDQGRDFMNRLQILAARRHVFYRPRSGLEHTVRKTLPAREQAGRC